MPSEINQDEIIYTIIGIACVFIVILILYILLLLYLLKFTKIRISILQALKKSFIVFIVSLPFGLLFSTGLVYAIQENTSYAFDHILVVSILVIVLNIPPCVCVYRYWSNRIKQSALVQSYYKHTQEIYDERQEKINQYLIRYKKLEEQAKQLGITMPNKEKIDDYLNKGLVNGYLELFLISLIQDDLDKVEREIKNKTKKP